MVSKLWPAVESSLYLLLQMQFYWDSHGHSFMYNLWLFSCCHIAETQTIWPSEFKIFTMHLYRKSLPIPILNTFIKKKKITCLNYKDTNIFPFSSYHKDTLWPTYESIRFFDYPGYLNTTYNIVSMDFLKSIINQF